MSSCSGPPQATQFDGSRATARNHDRGAVAPREIVGNGVAFINFTKAFLLSGYGSLLLPHEAFVVEVLETVKTASAEVVHGECRRLRSCGVPIALDDVTDVDRIEAFEGEVDFVKSGSSRCARKGCRSW